jgi:hypothetical protein
VEKLAQFDRERIPERVVHARGASAKGFFEVGGHGGSCHAHAVAAPKRGPCGRWKRQQLAMSATAKYLVGTRPEVAAASQHACSCPAYLVDHVSLPATRKAGFMQACRAVVQQLHCCWGPRAGLQERVCAPRGFLQLLHEYTHDRLQAAAGLWVGRMLMQTRRGELCLLLMHAWRRGRSCCMLAAQADASAAWHSSGCRWLATALPCHGWVTFTFQRLVPLP